MQKEDKIKKANIPKRVRSSSSRAGIRPKGCHKIISANSSKHLQIYSLHVHTHTHTYIRGSGYMYIHTFLERKGGSLCSPEKTLTGISSKLSSFSWRHTMTRVVLVDIARPWSLIPIFFFCFWTYFSKEERYE